MKKNSSLRRRILFIFLLFFIPVLGLLLVTSFYSLHLTERQLLETNQAALDNYARDRSAAMDAIAMDVSGFFTFDNSLDNMQYIANESERTLARVTVFSHLQSSAARYPELGMLFAYSGYSRDYLYTNGAAMTMPQRLALRDRVQALLTHTPSPPLGVWEPLEIGGDQYLLYLNRVDDMFVGAALSVQTLLAAPGAQGDESTVLLVRAGRALFPTEELFGTAPEVWLAAAQDGAGYTRGATGVRYLVTCSPLNGTGASLLTIQPARFITKGVSSLQILINLLVGFVGLAIPALYFYFTRSVMRPLNKLVLAMRSAPTNPRQQHVDMRGCADEFEQLGQVYNSMFDEIGQLEAENREKETQRQRAQLHNLQLQIAPHFLMNSLNMVYNAATGKDWIFVQEMTTYLVRYFRYFVQLKGEWVRLVDEMQFTKDYLHLQSLRMPDKFEYELRCPPFLTDFFVPSMSIKTFAENCIKHAVGHVEYLRFCVAASLDSQDGRAYIRLDITDNGPGFDAHTLAALQRGGAPIARDGVLHTGIWNLEQRLALLYGPSGRLLPANRPDGGARILLLLPADGGKEDTDVSGAFSG